MLVNNNRLSVGISCKKCSFAVLALAVLAGCASSSVPATASKADSQQSRNARNESPPMPRTETAAIVPVSTASAWAASAATTLDACDRHISGNMKKNHKIKFWEFKGNPGGKMFEEILENIRIMERTNVQMNCKVRDAGKSVYSYQQAIDFVMMHAKRERVLKDIYDFEFHQIALAMRLSGNQMILDGNFGNFQAEASKVAQWMFKTIIRLRRENQQSQAAIDSSNRTLIGAMAGVASYVLIAKALDRILPAVSYSSSSSTPGSVAPANVPTNSTSRGRTSSGGAAKGNSSSRGVERITDNGKLSGVPSHRVQCRSGGSHVIYYKNGTWYHGSWMGMGSKYDSWSVGQLAEHLCK